MWKTWDSMGVLKWKDPWQRDYTELNVLYDTGFCNRIFHWEIASHLNHQFHNFTKIGKNISLEYIGGVLGVATSKKYIGGSVLTKFDKIPEKISKVMKNTCKPT